MFCKECGAELMDGAKICVMCGAPQDTDDPAHDPLADALEEPWDDNPFGAPAAFDTTDDLPLGMHEDASQEALGSVLPFVGTEEDASVLESTGVLSGERNPVPTARLPRAATTPTRVVARSAAAPHEAFPEHEPDVLQEAYPETDSYAAVESLGTPSDDEQYTPGFEWTDADELQYEADEPEEEFEAYTPTRFAVKEERPGASRLKAIIASVVVLALLGGVGYGVYTFVANNAADILAEEEHPPVEAIVAEEPQVSASAVEVTVPLWVPWLESDGSNVPVGIRGEKADGTQVNDTVFISSDGLGLKLDPGEYKLVVLGSPISADGVIYTYTDQTLRIGVAEDGTVTLGTTTPTLTPIDATEVKDAQIEEAYQWVLKDPKKASKAKALAKAARDRREGVLKSEAEQKSLAQKKAEEEAKKKAEEEAKKKEEEEKKKEEEEKKKAEEEAKTKAEEEAKRQAEAEAAAEAERAAEEARRAAEEAADEGGEGGGEAPAEGDQTGGETAPETGGGEATGGDAGGEVAEG